MFTLTSEEWHIILRALANHLEVNKPAELKEPAMNALFLKILKHLGYINASS